MVDEFPSNSQQRRKRNPDAPVEKEIEAVVQGPVKRRKQSLSKRFQNLVFGGDAKDAASSVFFETLIPSAKDMMVAALQELPELIFYGDRASRGRRPGRGGWTPYRDAADRKGMSHRGRMMHEFDEIVHETRPEAEEVLDRMLDLLDRFNAVSVADFYNLCNTSSSPADRNWGWTSLAGADVVRARGGGYVVSLPKTDNLK